MAKRALAMFRKAIESFQKGHRIEAELMEAFSDKVKVRPQVIPLVSIVIPAYKNYRVTARCLMSVARSSDLAVPSEIIVVDDASPDHISRRFAQLPTLTVLRNSVNLGFVGASNRGAELARGKYIVFLNNDTVVKRRWLEALVIAAESDARIGVVGSKLVYPNGTLQEAGAIIFRDGSGSNYGRNGDAASVEYNFAREVDYCSGAALLVRTDLFRNIGGFSPEFAPGYYEDADLCFEAWRRGFKVLYEPRSEVIHYEGLSAGTNLFRGMKRFQTVNRSKFLNKWHDVLQSHYENDPSNEWLAAMRRLNFCDK